MSSLIDKEIVCPHCKHPTSAELWSSINVKEDPELKDLLIGGEINMVTCLACKELFYAESFLLYHDPVNELMAIVYPSDQKEMGELLIEKTRADFHAGQKQALEDEKISYEPVSLFGLNDLVALVEQVEEEALQSEVAEAIAKQQGLSVRRIRPWLARSQGLPRVVPVEEKAPNDRAAVEGGLRRLKAINDLLTVYNAALDRLSREPAAEIRLV